LKKEELQQHNGKEGNKAYVSCDGRVYDVSESRLWKNGRHVNRHEAGMDLSEAMQSAPHGAEVLERFRQIGALEGFRMNKETGKKAVIKKLYRIFHPHPMLIHFPMGLLVFTVIMQVLFFVTGRISFEQAGFYSLVTSVIFMFPTILSGMVSWWVNYELAVTKIFMLKLSFSFVLLLMGLGEVAVRFFSPDIAVAGGFMSTFYNIMLFVNIPVLGVIGFNGGKLSWG
jgi:predicted heme/steroid binding protein